MAEAAPATLITTTTISTVAAHSMASKVPAFTPTLPLRSSQRTR